MISWNLDGMTKQLDMKLLWIEMLYRIISQWIAIDMDNNVQCEIFKALYFQTNPHFKSFLHPHSSAIITKDNETMLRARVWKHWGIQSVKKESLAMPG